MANFLTTKKGKVFLGYLYGWGASIVIIGAWGKILHLSWADLALTVGLLTEALIFFVSAFEPVHEEIDWSIVYPELGDKSLADSKKKRSGMTPTQQLDAEMEKAKIGPELIKNLGTSFEALNKNVSKMADLSDAAVVTEQYAVNVKQAASSVGIFGKAAHDASEAISQMSVASKDSKAYHDQIQVLVKNLGQVNSMYELELKESGNHLKMLNDFYANVGKSMKSLEEAVEDSKKYKEEMARLSKNLSSLNAIYGNMLTAMSAPRV
jgi:gliding motility-associated protein GldL